MQKIPEESVEKVGVGQTKICTFEQKKYLTTSRLVSCYGIIVIAMKKNGEKAIGLSHWIGSEDNAEYTIQNMKCKLAKQLGTEEISFNSIAIGGGGKSYTAPCLTQEIKTLKDKGLINVALCDLNTPSQKTIIYQETTIYIIIKDDNQILIQYYIPPDSQVLKKVQTDEKNTPFPTPMQSST